MGIFIYIVIVRDNDFKVWCIVEIKRKEFVGLYMYFGFVSESLILYGMFMFYYFLR